MRIRSRLVAVCAIVLVVACGGGSECKVETIHYTKSLNGVSSGGETQGVTVARFDLTQDFVSHTPYTACAQGPTQDVGVVRAKITSLWPVPVRLFYDVQAVGSDSVPRWFHYDSIMVLKPNETVDVGDVITTPTKLSTVTTKVLVSKIFTLP